jgi:hypothetical protein
LTLKQVPFALSLIEEKTGSVFACVYPEKSSRPLRARCSRCEKYFSPRRKEPQRTPRIFINVDHLKSTG